MSASDASRETLLQKWKQANSWLDLLRLYAHYIDGTDALTPHAVHPASHAQDLKTSLLRCKIRLLGALRTRGTRGTRQRSYWNNPDSGLWKHASSRAVLHCTCPQISPDSRIEALVQEIVVDDMEIEYGSRRLQGLPRQA
jgi:hypothetical protein